MSTLGAAVSSADNFTTLYKSATKNFSKHGILVEILLVEHRLHDVIEVVVQDSARSYEISRFYISTSILFSKFSAEEIDQHLALKKAEFSDVNKDFQYSKEPQESKIVERVIQDLAVLHVKARLDIQSGGTLKASLIVLPGDTTNADGQLDQICEMPPNMRKYQSFDLTQVEIRTKASCSSLEIVVPIADADEKCCTTFSSSSPCRRKTQWISIFRRLVLVMEITQMKRRLELMAMIKSLPISLESRRLSANYFGRNSRRYSQIYEFIAAGPIGMIETTSETSITPGQGGFERRFEQYNPSPTLNALSWDQITSHRVDTRTGSKCPQKWNPNGRTLGDKLATTTLFRRSQIRQSRFSLLPIITDQIGKNKYTNDDVVGFAHRGAAVTPNPGQRRGTDPATAFFIEKEEVAEIPNNMSFLKRKSITKKELAPITLFSPSPTPLSKDSLCESDLCLSPNRGSEEESAPSAQEVTSEYSRYELEFHPRIKKTLTPLAWKSKSSSTQSCDKLTEHFGFFGAKSQNGIGSKSRGFQSRKRHSTGQTPVNNPGTRNAPRETRRKSSGSNAVSSLRNRRPVVPEIPRGAVLIAQLKRGLSFSRLTAAIDSIRDSFNVSEKKEKEMDSVGPRGFCDAPVEGEGESSAVTGEYDYSTGFDEMSCSREYNAGATTPTAIKLLQCSSAQHSLLQDISENPLDCLAMAIASS